ncbi:MAG: hypothetical protein COS14_02385 [Bacteroidetes bacterium CG02_land_8_20_14_3_00_31_25]|nr:MAG: hypothetical protein COS14_02385 [Bacteroidetes bacterium CG02_land_8_20_14_3_00_31_25]
MKYNPNIHNRRAIRLKGYDYSQAGAYFITICLHNRECLFGKIKNGEMILNDAGIIANECWLQIPEHFPNAILHEHIVMPNYMHGIIELIQNDDAIVVGVENFQPLPNAAQPQRPIWQRNYYEHIIRNEQSYQTISNYIINNPTKWKNDKFFVE